MSLILNLRHLQAADEPNRLQKSLNLDELLSSRRDVKPLGNFQTDLTAEDQSGVISVHGSCTGDAEFVCSRCLTEYMETMNVAIEHVFSKDQEIVETDREERIELVSEDKLDLQPYVEEDILLALPFVLLCKADCKGLCSQCGQNFNEGTCNCETETIDPRLEKLKSFFK